MTRAEIYEELKAIEQTIAKGEDTPETFLRLIELDKLMSEVKE